MTLENLLRTGQLKAHAADERELQRLLDSAQLALKDAAFADLSGDSRLNLAYRAMMQAALACARSAIKGQSRLPHDIQASPYGRCRVATPWPRVHAK